MALNLLLNFSGTVLSALPPTRLGKRVCFGQDHQYSIPITHSYGRGAALLVIENVPVVVCPDCGESYVTATRSTGWSASSVIAVGSRHRSELLWPASQAVALPRLSGRPFCAVAGESTRT